MVKEVINGRFVGLKGIDTNSGRQELQNYNGHCCYVLYVSYKPAPAPLKIYFEGRIPEELVYCDRK